MQLFLPAKQGNFDCTFCFDCVRACPHDNVALASARPIESLARDALTSGIARLSSRVDFAALAAVLSFGAFANAAGMVAPVVEWQMRLSAALGAPRLTVVSLFYGAALVALPLTTLAAAAALSRRAAGRAIALPRVAARFAMSLIPLGFAMWLAHYSFHLVTSYATIVPVAQRMAHDGGLGGVGLPEWTSSCCAVPPDWLWKAEVLALDMGLLASLFVALRVAEETAPGGRRALAAFAPWALLITALFAIGVWIVFQPMEMRGTFGSPG